MLMTSADLTTYYGADILRQWADDDKDGVADTLVLDSAISKVSSRIETALKPWFPSVVPFAVDNVPDAIADIALRFAGLMLAGRRQEAAEHYRKSYNEAQQELQTLCRAGACLLFDDGSTVYAEGSSQAEPNGGAWSSNTAEGRENTFSDDSLKDF